MMMFVVGHRSPSTCVSQLYVYIMYVCTYIPVRNILAEFVY